MPFEQITTIRHIGPVTPEDKFLIHTTAGDYVGGIEFTGYPSRALCLHRDHWPQAVVKAASNICNKLHRRGIDATPAEVTAWISSEPRLREAAEGFAVELRWGQSNERARVAFEGTIISLTPL